MKGSKGKKAYFTEINVLFVQQSGSCSPSPLRVVIDTGAAESVAGMASMSRLVDGGRFSYTVLLDDRPRFRFGNGQTQTPVSKVRLECPALGAVSFYLLDQSRTGQYSSTAWSTRSSSTTCAGVLQGRLAGAQGQMVGKFTRDLVEWALGIGSTTTSRTSSSSSEAAAERPLQCVAWSNS